MLREEEGADIENPSVAGWNTGDLCYAVARHLATPSPAAWWDIDHRPTEAIELGKCEEKSRTGLLLATSGNVLQERKD